MTLTTRRRGVLASVIACAVILGGCKVDTTVSIKSDEAGRGTVSVVVELDAEAAFALQSSGAPLAERVRLGDLDGAGWTVSPWAADENGAVSLHLSKAFVGEDQLQAVLTEITGSGGMLDQAHIGRSRGIVRSSDELAVAADLRGLDAGLAGDAEVSRRLTEAGVDVAALEAILTEGLGSAFGLSVVLRVGDEHRAWRLSPGDRRSMAVSNSRVEWDKLTTLGIAAILTLLAVLLFLAAWVSAHRRKKERRRTARDRPKW